MTDEASPRPWHVMRFSEEDEPDRIVDANGDEVAIELLEADAALIVDAVNERDDLVENLKTANENRERENAVWASLVKELKAERDRAVKYAEAAPHPGSASWKEMQAVYAERDRLRDIIKRLITVREKVFWRKDEKTGLMYETCLMDEDEARKTIEEAKAAIKEDKE